MAITGTFRSIALDVWSLALERRYLLLTHRQPKLLRSNCYPVWAIILLEDCPWLVASRLWWLELLRYRVKLPLTLTILLLAVDTFIEPLCIFKSLWPTLSMVICFKFFSSFLSRLAIVVSRSDSLERCNGLEWCVLSLIINCLSYRSN